MAGPYKFIEALCRLATAHEETIVTQWGNKAIIVEPGDDPFTIYKEMRLSND